MPSDERKLARQILRLAEQAESSTVDRPIIYAVIVGYAVTLAEMILAEPTGDPDQDGGTRS